MRTKDWACYLCGYPLASPVFKLVDKTYGQVRQERLYSKKMDAQEEQQINDSIETEKSIAEEMQDVPIVTYTDVEEITLAYRETPVMTNESTEEQMSTQPATEQEEVCETVTSDEENKPAEIVEVYQEVHEEIAVSAGPVEEPETITEITELNEDTETVKEEPVADIEIESIEKEEFCVEPIPETPEPAMSEEQVQNETEPAVSEETVRSEAGTLAPADIDITIDELLAEYAADYTLATAKYVNRVLRLSGHAAAIDVKEVLAINYIRLTDASLNLTKSVQCMFDKKHAGILKGLEKGQQVTIQGKYTGSLIAMRMTDCIVVQS
jgi:hypothetical protein